MKDGLIRNSDNVIIQLQLDDQVWPGSAIIRFERVDRAQATDIHLITGETLRFTGPVGDALWRQVRL